MIASETTLHQGIDIYFFILYFYSDTTLENATKEDNSLTHFSSFAISAKDGSTRWHHLPGDFGEIDTSVKVFCIAEKGITNSRLFCLR